MDDIQRDVQDALVWLDLVGARALMRSLLRDDPARQEATLRRLVPDLVGVADLSDPRWVDALLEELELRVAPDEDGEEDPDSIATREVPNLARFAADIRSHHGDDDGADGNS